MLEENKNCAINDNIEKEEAPKNKREFIKWIKANIKYLFIAGISLSALSALIYGVKNKNSLKSLWEKLNEKIKKGNMYSSKWFSMLTDEELDVEREKVRLAYCSSGDDFSESCKLQRLLWRFDEEMSNRAWGDEIRHGPAFRREHGWYLSNDD